MDAALYQENCYPRARWARFWCKIYSSDDSLLKATFGRLMQINSSLSEISSFTMCFVSMMLNVVAIGSGAIVYF